MGGGELMRLQSVANSSLFAPASCYYADRVPSLVSVYKVECSVPTIIDVKGNRFETKH